MKCFLSVVFFFSSFMVAAQSVSQQLQKAFQQFEKDNQLKHAISSLYVIDAKTGQVVFDKNSQIGLAPASTQKIITSVTAFELLGKEYRYKTELGYDGIVKNDSLFGNIYFTGFCDPTLGSWRYNSSKDEIVINNFSSALRKKSIKNLIGGLYINERQFGGQTIPDGWIWQDIGNYYGAGAGGFNWRENQYDILLKSGSKEGSTVKILNSKLRRTLEGITYNELRVGKPGSGDNAYIYFSPRSTAKYLKGTIPPNEDSFKISGSLYSPTWLFYQEFLSKSSINIKYIEFESGDNFRSYQVNGQREVKIEHDSMILGAVAVEDIIKFEPFKDPITQLYTHYSPSLDSIIYWFNKKSINLYGEALIKTFAYEKQGFGSTDSGLAIVKKFWKGKGLDEDELNIYDGSGLSPLNRVTTHAQVEILKYAKTKDWFPYFLKSLPDYNGMNMKSGTISDVKGFCGYHTAKDGKEYIFSFLVNNYSGKTSGVVGKMYKVLDELK